MKKASGNAEFSAWRSTWNVHENGLFRIRKGAQPKKMRGAGQASTSSCHRRTRLATAQRAPVLSSGDLDSVVAEINRRCRVHRASHHGVFVRRGVYRTSTPGELETSSWRATESFCFVEHTPRRCSFRCASGGTAAACGVSASLPCASAAGRRPHRRQSVAQSGGQLARLAASSKPSSADIRPDLRR